MIKKTLISNTSVFPTFYEVDREGNLNYNAKIKGANYHVVHPLYDMHVTIQKNGNTKTGEEWLLNTLPGEKPITVQGQPITNMRGSCQGVCDGCEGFCYAIQGCRRHHNAVMPAVIRNSSLYRNDPTRFVKEIIKELSSWQTKAGNEKVFRWHSSGEIESYEYLEMMTSIATMFPSVHFYTYTKRFNLVERYLDEHGDFPANFVMNLSVWEDNLVKAGFNLNYLSKVQCFEWKDRMSVYDYNHSIHCQSVIHNKEGEKKGHLNHEMNCKKCGLCWKGKCKGKTIYVYNH
mgnify:CR=1 FL=1